MDLLINPLELLTEMTPEMTPDESLNTSARITGRKLIQILQLAGCVSGTIE